MAELLRWYLLLTQTMKRKGGFKKCFPPLRRIYYSMTELKYYQIIFLFLDCLLFHVSCQGKTFLYSVQCFALRIGKNNEKIFHKSVTNVGEVPVIVIDFVSIVSSSFLLLQAEEWGLFSEILPRVKFKLCLKHFSIVCKEPSRGLLFQSSCSCFFCRIVQAVFCCFVVGWKSFYF